MKKLPTLLVAISLVLTACASQSSAPAVETPMPEAVMPAGTEEAMHMAETQTAEDAMHMEESMATEEAMHMAETQTAEDAMHMEESMATEQAMHAEETSMAAMPETMMLSGAFVKEEVSVTGSYTFDPATGQLTFSDDFGVVTGPDLFVVLSGASDLTVDFQTFSSQVTNAPILSLGNLTQTTGAQTYAVPEGTDLTQYNTVVIWCQSFSVAFAAAPLAAEG